MMPALPFAIIAAIGVSRIVAGPGWGLLPLLAVGPAVAAAAGGPLSTLAAGALALAVCVLFAAGMQPGATHRMAEVALLAVAGVTAAGALASRARGRRDRDLAQARLVAEAAQQVLLRPVPRQAGPVRLAARYLSASRGARVGGDLYEVVTTPDCVRLVVGDAQGKGLPAAQPAAAVLGVFREAAHEEDSLAAIVCRIETSLARQLSDDQFVTAILAEISADGTKIELLSCGHPAPLLLGTTDPRFACPQDSSLPLGLGQLADVPRIPVTIAFEPGDVLLFYTDGASEARNKAGVFFPLADCAAVRAPPDPATLPGRLGDEVIRHVGHPPDDDMALLVIYRDGALTRPGTGDGVTAGNGRTPGRAGSTRPGSLAPPWGRSGSSPTRSIGP
jgi:serine phosphatase RsbU (regulator of sigma subunit)